MKELLIATNNSGKQVEIQDILGDLEIRLLTPKQLGITLDVEENGQTYAENALLKAHTFQNVTTFRLWLTIQASKSMPWKANQGSIRHAFP